LFTTREIVAVETPAISATSRIVTRCADLLRVSVAALEGMCKPYMYATGLSKQQMPNNGGVAASSGWRWHRYTLDS
jgi:hypothetical protein